MASDWLTAVKARLKANREYAEKFQFAAHDKIELIGQTSALHMTLGDRLTDLDKAIRIIELQDAALKEVEAKSGKCIFNFEQNFMEGSAAAFADTATIASEALAEAEKIKGE